MIKKLRRLNISIGASFWSDGYTNHPVPRRNAVVNIFLIVCKNILGVFFIMLGTVMLITPGQGLLMILAGIAVGNLPGKYRLERWLITRPPVWRTIQYLRRKAGVAPLQMPLPDSFH